MSLSIAAVRRFQVLLLGVSLLSAVQAGEETGPFKELKFRSLGPAAGGRVCRVAGVPGDPLTYYAATAAGGIWKSSDGGVQWRSIFDDQPVSTIGSIAIAPSDPNVIYAGSGEANIRGNVEVGNGIYKSTDAGKTWKQVWKQEGQIGTMIVHPRNSNIAFAAVLGHAFGPNGERGIYRTKDGGRNWERVLGKDPDTGASDVCFDPSNPHILFAGLWQVRRRPWELTSGGPGSGLYVSRDGGDSWTQLKEKGLPEGIWGKVCVAVAPSDGRRVYAMIEAEKGGLFRSDDGGDTWHLASSHHGLRQRAWYFSMLTVDPGNPDIVWFPQVALLKTIDGGKTMQSVKGPHHGDHHDVWIDPRNPRRVIAGNDGGVDITTNGGETWFAPPLPIAQFYHISVDNRTPYYVSGTMQDIGCAAGPSNSLAVHGVGLEEWYTVGGGETGYTAHDPNEPNIIYAGEYGGTITRYDHRTRQARNVSIYPDNPSGHGAEDMRFRFRWPAPILMSPHDPKTIYHAANVLFKTTDGGQSWSTISQDLTRNDRAKQRWSGGPITGDNTTAEYYCTISAVTESTKKKDVLWVGTDDGWVQISRDGGKSWTNVTANMPRFPEWATIKTIESSPHDPGAALVVVDAHMLDDMHPYLFRTTDYGRTWKALSSKLPENLVLHVVREDPRKKGTLYLGTARGVMLSIDDGDNWQPLKLNLPTVAVHDIVVKDNALVLGTNGRSIWILDDLLPIKEFTPQVNSSPVHLFPPPPVIRWHYHGVLGNVAPGENPQQGAAIYYYLKSKPQGDIKVDILDSEGNVVQTLKNKPDPEEPKTEGDYEEDPEEKAKKEKERLLSVEPGLHRVIWDLHHKGAEKIRGAKVDAGDPKAGPLAIPGAYTLRLVVENKPVTAPLVVAADPRITVPLAELTEQLRFALALRDDLIRLTHTVEQLRAVRQQLTGRNELVKDDPRADDLRKHAQELITKLDALEARFHNPKAQVTYDILAQKGGSQLYSKLTTIYEAVMEGDGLPTQGVRDVYSALAQIQKQLEGEWNKIVADDLDALNEKAKKLDLPHVIVPIIKK